MEISISKIGNKIPEPIRLTADSGRFTQEGFFLTVNGEYPNSDIIVNLKITPKDFEYMKHIHFENENL